MYSVTVQGNTIKELAANAQTLASSLNGPSTVVVTQAQVGNGGAGSLGDSPKAEPKPASKPEPKAAPTKPASKPEPKAAPTKPAPKPEPKADTIDLGTLRELGKQSIKAGKGAEMRDLLSSLGSESITALEEEKYAEFKAGIEAIINGDEPAAAADEDDAL